MTRARAHNPLRRRAFTVLELIVVLWIVALLIGLILGIGPRVLDAQRANATRSVVVTLDRMLDAYMADNSNMPPPYNPFDYEFIPGRYFTATSTAAENEVEMYMNVDNNEPHVRHPDAAIFLAQVRGYEAIDPILRAIPPQLIVRTNIPDNNDFWRPPGASDDAIIESGPATIIDAWGTSGGNWSPNTPVYEKTFIHYVHPDNELAQRLYGRCLNNRPYFFSAGPDRLYGVTNQMNRTEPGVIAPAVPGTTRDEFVARALRALDDNIYSYQPDLPDRSDNFGTNIR